MAIVADVQWVAVSVAGVSKKTASICRIDTGWPPSTAAPSRYRGMLVNILVDYVMPGRDNLVGYARVTDRLPGIPIIILPGFVSRTDVVRLIEAAVQDLQPANTLERHKPQPL